MKFDRQVRLGFNQVKAAVLGGHDLIEAWHELRSMMEPDKVFLLHGGILCFMLCLEAVTSAVPIPQAEDQQINDFLHGSVEDRRKFCAEAIGDNDMKSLFEAVCFASTSMQPYIGSIKFSGDLPYFEP